MGSLMCVDVDVDVSLDAEDEAEVNDERDVVETLESEVREAKENGDGTLRDIKMLGLRCRYSLLEMMFCNGLEQLPMKMDLLQ